MRGRSGYQISVYILGFDCSERPSETLKDLRPTPCEGIWILEYANFFIAVSGLLGFGILNAAQGVQNPVPTSRIHGVESIIQDCLGFSYMER